MTVFNVSMLLTADADQARRELKGAEAEVIKFGAAARQAGNTAAAGFDRAEAEILQFKRASSGATSNLVAQFNDVGQMLIAGQSPLLLAAQQGTQISQALGPLGARGAVQALGSAFLGMLSPVNLAVFAAVAGLGLLGRALSSLLGDADSVEDRLAEVKQLTDDLERSTKAYRDAAAASRVSVADLRIEYNDLADEIERVRDQQERLTRAQGEFNLNAKIDELAGRAGGKALDLIGPADIDELDALIGKIDLAQVKLSDFRGEDRALFYQLAALRDLAEQYGITGDAALEIVRASGLLENTSGAQAQAAAAAELALELEKSLGSTEAVEAALPGVLAALQAIVEQAGGMAAEIGAGADEAGRLAQNLAAAQQRIAAQGKVYSGRGGDPRTSNSQGVGEFVYTGPALDANNEPIARRSSGGGRGGARGGASRAREIDQAQRLITSLERELDLLRATDPVQKEMIRNREALATATVDQRAQVEELIRARQREDEQQRQSKELWEFTQNTVYDVFDALIIQGEKASDVMASLAKSIASALLQSALLGTGPLAGIFGGQGTGLLPAIGDLLGFATGGYIAGPGGPRDDKVLARLSNGEFVVNAAATARHRPLLEAINSAPGYASGGFVGPSGGAAPAGASGPMVIELRLSDDVDARIAETSEQVSVRVMRGGLQEYDAKVLPRRMKAISADPRRVG